MIVFMAGSRFPNETLFLFAFFLFYLVPYSDFQIFGHLFIFETVAVTANQHQKFLCFSIHPVTSFVRRSVGCSRVSWRSRRGSAALRQHRPAWRH